MTTRKSSKKVKSRETKTVQLNRVKHQDIIEALDAVPNQSEFIIAALRYYIASGKTGGSSGPDTSGDDTPPFDPSGLALALKEGIRDGMREIAPAIGQAVASAVGTGFSVNRVEMPPDPVALEAGRKAELLASITAGLDDWGQQ